MKLIFIIIGVLSLALGVIGIVVPLLPTTPFLLLSAALFIRSSPRLYEWLITNPLLGKYIRNYQEHREIPMHGKICSITMLWLSILYGIIYVANEHLWIQGLLLTIAVAITWHLLSLGTTPRK